MFKYGSVFAYYNYCCFLLSAITTISSNCTDGELRLVDGTNPLEGRVEICINNAWGTVCDNVFTGDDADVVCEQIVHQMNTVHNGEYCIELLSCLQTAVYLHVSRHALTFTSQ